MSAFGFKVLRLALGTLILMLGTQALGMPAPASCETPGNNVIETWPPLFSEQNAPQTIPPWRLYQPKASPVIATTRIAIIIDDIGHQRSSSQMSAELPGDITLSILPFSPYANAAAEWAEQNGKEIMLHVPMEPEVHRAWKDGLSQDMNERELRQKLIQMINSLPGIRGVNNHMGSALTQNTAAMGWVMDELKQRQLYFIDSRTSDKTQALKAARANRLPSDKRDVFLDNVRKPAAIAKQFEKLLLLAAKRGSAIAIGHPYPETLAFLRSIKPLLDAHAVELVPVSHLLKQKPPELSLQHTFD